jgi:hypothetical protein
LSLLAGSSAIVAVTAPLIVRLPAVAPLPAAADGDDEAAAVVPAGVEPAAAVPADVDPAFEWLFPLLQAVATTLIAKTTTTTVRFMRRC